MFRRAISVTAAVLLLAVLSGVLSASLTAAAAVRANEDAVLPKMAVSEFRPLAIDEAEEASGGIGAEEDFFPPEPEEPEPEEPEEPENGNDGQEAGDPDAEKNAVPPDPVTEYPLGPMLYDYSSPVPESDAVRDSYFSDAVFIGDSRTVGLGYYGGVDAYFYSKVALTIRGVMSIPFIEDTNGKQPVTRTVIDTLKTYPNSFKKVYIAFGLNELGWSPTAFINTYEEVLRQIMDILPDADIYIQAVIPVAGWVSERGTNGVTNDHVRDFNKRLQALAEKMKVFYVDLDSGYYDDKGNLPDGMSSDGIHFGTAICREIMEYYRTHVVRKDDYLWE